ncbi:MAG: hypothetical protein FDZ75_02810 [Actinobacteria bacterium]|nr:MAG: hypothetical protein FDZ75_02810 [Actinomycetota bacterium]
MRGRALRLSFAVLEAALAASLAVTLVGCSSSTGKTSTSEPTSTAASGEPIKIGAVISLTGPYAGLGEPEKNTLEMEVERINAAGGVNGRPVELVIEDDATDEAKAVAATSKLIEQDGVVAVIGATGTGQTMAMRGDIERAGVPQVSMAGGTVITNPVSSLVFATPWSNLIVVPTEFAAMQKAGVKKIAIISDSGGFGKDGVAVLEKEAPNFGISIVDKETFNPGDTDFAAQLTKIKGSGADAMVMWAAGKEAASVVKQARDLGLKLP